MGRDLSRVRNAFALEVAGRAASDLKTDVVRSVV
jgi:hypothetical protein